MQKPYIPSSRQPNSLNRTISKRPDKPVPLTGLRLSREKAGTQTAADRTHTLGRRTKKLGYLLVAETATKKKADTPLLIAQTAKTLQTTRETLVGYIQLRTERTPVRSGDEITARKLGTEKTADVRLLKNTVTKFTLALLQLKLSVRTRKKGPVGLQLFTVGGRVMKFTLKTGKLRLQTVNMGTVLSKTGKTAQTGL